jgi:hypothetical protein
MAGAAAAGIQMLAPPQKRRRKKKIEEARRAYARERKRLQHQREKLGLCRVKLWLPGDAVAGLIRQMIVDGKITDEQALDHRKFEAALAQLLAEQGRRWVP